MYLVEKHKIKSSNKYFNRLCELAKISNNLYNQSYYWLRYSLENFGEWYNYYDLDKFMKQYVRVITPEYDNYGQLPAKVAQQTLKTVTQNMKSYVKSIKDWKKNRGKYRGMPKLPRFRKSNDMYILIFTNQSARLKSDKVIYFPKQLDGFTIELREDSIEKIQQVRIIPKGLYFIAEIVYEVPDPPLQETNEHVAGIDLGLSNLATLVFDDFSQPVLYNGKPLKSVNHYFNDKVSEYKSILDKTQKDQGTSRKLKQLYNKRNDIMDNCLHQISRHIVNLLVEKGITKLIVGKNAGQKQKNKMKNFVQVPVFRLLDYLRYKCERVGIEFIVIDESYTSGTSYIDGEEPINEQYNLKRRISRGIFITNNGKRVNADVNSAYQILKKAEINVPYQGQTTIFNPIKITI